jgi:hypothetical protein
MLQWRSEHNEASGERSELMLKKYPNVHGHGCEFQPCAVPVLVAITLVDRPGSTSSKGGE